MFTPGFRLKLRSIERSTWLDDDTKAQRHLFEAFVGLMLVACSIIVVCMGPMSWVVVVVGLTVGVAGFVMMIHGAFDLRSAHQRHRRRQQQIDLCPTKEVYIGHLRRRPDHAHEVFGSAFVDKYPHLMGG